MKKQIKRTRLDLVDERPDIDVDYITNEIISRIKDLTIDCPECETIIHDDDQYQCGTCGGGSKINVLNWLKYSINKITP